MEPIHVVFCVRDEQGTYLQHTAAAMASILENTQASVQFHLVCDDTVTSENRGCLEKFVTSYGAEVSFHELSEDDVNRLREVGNRIRGLKNFNIGMLQRFFIPSLLADVEKVIYLDSDIIVNLDLRELWEREFSGFSAMVVRDRKETREKWRNRAKFAWLGLDYRHYFNSGMLFLNLKALRGLGDFSEEAINLRERYAERLAFADQDVMNALLRGRVLFLPERFNFIPFGEISERTLEQPELIIHFAGVKPWAAHATPLDYLYWRYFMKTPWNRDMEKLPETISRLRPTVDYALSYRGGVYSRKLFLKGIARHLRELLPK